MRLIDADALIMDYISDDAENDAEIISRNDILDAPTVDAEPIKHGEWIESKVGGHCKCSLCGDYALAEYPFCPNCGAKMIGERKEE